VKKFIVPALVGWAFAALFGPRELVALVRRK
jgi:hypothetical protein